MARLAILLACLGDVALAALMTGQAGFMPRRKMSIVGGLSSLGADEKATVAGLGLGVDESKGKELRDGSGGSREEAGAGGDAGMRVVIEECSDESGEAMAFIPSHIMLGAGGGTKGAGLVAEIRMRVGNDAHPLPVMCTSMTTHRAVQQGEPCRRQELPVHPWGACRTPASFPFFSPSNHSVLPPSPSPSLPLFLPPNSLLPRHPPSLPLPASRSLLSPLA